MNEKKTLGRKPVPIDWAKVDQLLISGCSGKEVASYIGITDETLYNRCKKEHGEDFSAYLVKKRQKGNSLLKHKQFQVAMQENTTMLVWLGKQRLKQKENPQSDEEFNGSLAELLDLLKKKVEKKDEHQN